MTEVAKMGGEMWRNLKSKTEWEKKAVKAKEDYEKAMKEYQKNGGGGVPVKETGKKRPKKDSKKPAKKGKKASEDEDDDEEESE